LSVNLLTLIPAPETAPALSITSSTNLAPDFSGLLLQLVGAQLEPADKIAAPTPETGVEIPTAVSQREKGRPPILPLEIGDEGAAPFRETRVELLTAVPLRDERRPPVLPILQDVKKIEISVHHEVLNTPEPVPPPQELPAKPVITTDPIASSKLAQLPPRIECTPENLFQTLPTPIQPAPEPLRTRPSVESEPRRVPDPLPFELTQRVPAAVPLVVYDATPAPQAPREEVTPVLPKNPAATRPEMTTPRPQVVADPMTLIKAPIIPPRIEPAEGTLMDHPSEPSLPLPPPKQVQVPQLQPRIQNPIITTDPIANTQSQNILIHVEPIRRTLIDESSETPAATSQKPAIATEPAPAKATLQLQAPLMPVQKVPGAVKSMDRRDERSTTEPSDTTVPVSVTTESAAARSATPVDQPAVAQPVELPQLPKLQLVRTVAVEVGDAESQVLVRIESRGSEMHLQFGAGSEALHQRIESSVGSLVDALKEQKINTSTVQISRRAPVDKVRRMKEAH